jgi:hypothetical protein
LSIIGLDNSSRPHSNTSYYSSQEYGLAPNDIRNVYDIPAPSSTCDGAGQTLALVELDTFNQADISTYDSTFSIPVAVPKAVGVDTFNPVGANPGIGPRRGHTGHRDDDRART